MARPGLFAWLQDADFYRDFHVAAAELMGPGGGRTWLDVGTGPGILARLAGARGYRVKGIDRDPEMIDAARGLAAERGSDVEFAVSDLAAESAGGRRYDVVSASSLVVVTADPRETLAQMKALTLPGGRLLIIEASPLMTRWRSVRLWATGRLGERGYMLLPWAMARSGSTLGEHIMEGLFSSLARHRLAHGLVNAWVAEGED